MKALFYLLLVFSHFTFAASPQESKPATELWIDVRSQSEFQQSHLKGAVNIPYTNIVQGIKPLVKNKDAVIHLYCAVGGRAQIAKLALNSLGYSNVVNEGGLDALVRKKMQLAD